MKPNETELLLERLWRAQRERIMNPPRIFNYFDNDPHTLFNEMHKDEEEYGMEMNLGNGTDYRNDNG